MFPGSMPVLEKTRRRTKMDDEGTAAAHMERIVTINLIKVCVCVQKRDND